ncbi:uncharacterized protein BXZ73DRAFT_110390 [Epithele typhae]|uniref:uncharacterized protein n=1 Tax=Epithele typhae TaxID=378194 RepID=UPI002008C232|nr:uncharacterized protein BXZ73DRAFT_110390 [Epithele typhae]KAH9907103.1 hypothetical protein BXZ73DRAFT_110390 [Epithele typhae]
MPRERPQDPSPILRKHSIPHCHWYERALRFHGSDTVQFQYYLLVDSVSNAEAVLLAAGWSPAVHPPAVVEDFWEPAVDGLPAVLSPPVAHPDAIPGEDDLAVLFDVQAWPGMSEDLSSSPDPNSHYPSLPRMYCALVHRVLDSLSERFTSYLVVQLAYLSAAVRSELPSPELLETIDPDLHQWHIDWLKGELNMYAFATLAHERSIREQARNGAWKLMEEGTAELGGLKYDREMEARIRASYGDGWKYEKISDDEDFDSLGEIKSDQEIMVVSGKPSVELDTEVDEGEVEGGTAGVDKHGGEQADV